MAGKSRRGRDRKIEKPAPRAPRPPPQREPDRAAHPADGFPIVAIGASAGGLEAATELLHGVSADLGAALVLVQHLDPAHGSILPEILTRTTPIPVRTIEDGMPVRPNAVFVIPPNHGLELTDGKFKLTSRQPAIGRPMPIDQFFRSLAETYATRAVGIVLSGTDSDGALGLQAIKAEGGIAIAQTPDSAKFPDMPRAAISEGPVDFVLAPREIARELAAVSRRIRLRSAAAEAEQPQQREERDGEHLSRIFAILRGETKVDFSLYRGTTIRRRIERRLLLTHVASLEDYVAMLHRNPKEVRALYDDLLITVTAFFREPANYEALATRIFPQILKHKNAETPVRIWVPGCATGEEVYSLAIVLFEALQGIAAPPPIQIFGTDVSDNAIEKARAATYLENAMVNVSPERMRAFFRKVDRGYQVSKRLRDVCVFARQNVASDPPFSNIDLLSCRNLLIYLEPTLQRRVLPLFHYALNPHGYLVLGSAETLGLSSDLFNPIDKSHRIFVKKAAAPHAVDFSAHAAMGGSVSAPERHHVGPPETPMRSPVDIGREADRVVLSRYAPAGVVVNENLEIVQFRGRTGRYLEPSPGFASFQLERMARDGLGLELRRMVDKARRTGERVRRTKMALGRGKGESASVDVEVIPMATHGRPGFFLVLFEERTARKEKTRRIRKEVRKASPAEERINRLEGELAATKEYLQSIIEEQEASSEELKSTNEEILSSNEELQSTNEELETAKEELQSTNEELRTVNDELQNKNLELSDLSNHLVNLFASINIPTVMIGAQGDIRRFTPLAEKLLNLRPSDVGRRIGEVRPNLVGSDLAAIAREVVETVSVREREVQDTDGRWYLLRGRPYRTVDNRIDGAVLLFLDIDPLKRSLEQVSRARFYAEALVESVRESLIVLDPNLSVITANQAFYTTFQTTPLQTDGKSLFELDGWTWAEPLRAPLQAVVEGDERVVNLEVEAELRRLGRRTLVVNSRQIDVPGETRRSVLLGIEDVTERKLAEERTKSSERRYRQIFESAREGIWILNGESGQILEVNPFLVELLGYPVETLTGRKPWELPIYESPEQARRAFEALREKGFAFQPAVRMKRRDGSVVQMEEVTTVYESGSRRLVQSNLRDVSERQALEDELRQAQKMESIGRLGGGLAHDFNNILNIVAAYAGLLDRDIDAEKKKETLAGIQKAVQRGAGVVRQLLTFARRDETSFQPVDVNEVARETAQMASETFPKRIAIELELASDLPKISADPNHIHQALLNLCVNSRDSIADRGKITLSTAVVPGANLRARFPETTSKTYVRASVADTGAGMDGGTRSRIFEPFFTTKGKAEGSGLGLPVVYGIVKNHSGVIDVESNPGKGTTVSLYFPVLAEGAGEGGPKKSRAKTSAASGRESPAAGAKVLVVEDEKMLLESTRALLESGGYRVVTAADGQEAVEAFAREGLDVDLVLLDLDLPRLSGPEAFQKIRAIDGDVRVLVMSGHTGAAGSKPIEGMPRLRKPFTAENLLSAVRKALEPPPVPCKRPVRGAAVPPPPN